MTEEDLHSKMTFERLQDFLSDHKKGELKRHLRVKEGKEEIVKNGSVYEIRGQYKLDEFINQKNKDIFMLYYSQHCRHCEAIMPEYQQTAQKLSHLDDKLQFGMIDVTQNDVDVQIRVYPTFAFYRRDIKTIPMLY